MRSVEFKHNDVVHKCDEISINKWRIYTQQNDGTFYMIVDMTTKLDPNSKRFVRFVVNRLYNPGSEASLKFWADALQEYHKEQQALA